VTVAPAQSYLDLYLAPLAPWLSQPDVTDLYINRPGEVWIEAIGGQITRHEEAALDEAHLWRLARQIASQSHQGINRGHPLLAAALPDGARVQIAAPPATRGDMAIAIRKHSAKRVPLSSYTTAAGPPNAAKTPHDDLRALLTTGDYATFMAEAIRRRLNIIISGGTSAGKTTLLSSLLHEIPSTERLIFIEDTPELQQTHLNSVGLIAARGGQGEAQVTTDDLLGASLRMRPDRIILGELRGPEAFTFLRAINTGHPGSLTTIHADSPDRAFVQLAMMALQADLGLSYDDVRQLVRALVDAVIQVERRDGRRVISEIMLTSNKEIYE
jgi:type IV secretion system protein VirB11